MSTGDSAQGLLHTGLVLTGILDARLSKPSVFEGEASAAEPQLLGHGEECLAWLLVFIYLFSKCSKIFKITEGTLKHAHPCLCLLPPLQSPSSGTPWTLTPARCSSCPHSLLPAQPVLSQALILASKYAFEVSLACFHTAPALPAASFLRPQTTPSSHPPSYRHH